ncbi:MAG TPA: hypothetical protein VI357_26035, partial [Mycobacteriales bacterium]
MSHLARRAAPQVVAMSQLGSYRALETTAGGAGAMTATPTDLARFGAALLDGTAVPRAPWREMTAFGPSGYGLGLADLTAAGPKQTGLGNLGEIPGYAALLVTDPATGRSLSLSATTTASPAALATEVSSAPWPDPRPPGSAGSITRAVRGCSSMAEHQLPKLTV